jgi:formate hydrogenlyase subunit 3/multisubunit Na+/H+ antiporter MnhD subunit
MVPAAANVVGLVVFWELMALSSLLLVLAEHQHRSEARSAAQWYAAMTHLSLLAIMFALFLLAGETGDETFDGIRSGAGAIGGGTRAVVFIAALVGFGAKAGVVPLHVWLPRAHPEAPSHASAVMSGAMVAMGVYGIVRVGWDLLGGGPVWWGVAVLVTGLVSAMFGVLHALLASDLKRLLAYSTTENIGLMFVGIGAAGVFAASGNRPLAAVALAAALLHVMNHAVFKGLLFLAAGSVLAATGQRDLDRLGGLARRMPVTGATFAVGAIAIAALPPLNGFVSEWMLLQALVHSLPSDVAVVAVAMPVAVTLVALSGGLAAAAFVKAFGTGFLAMPRSGGAATASEVNRAMLTGQVLLAAGCVAFAVAPMGFADPLENAVASVGGVADGPPVIVDGVGIRLAGIGAGLSPLLLLTALVAGAAGALTAVGRARRRRTVSGIVPWGCGRTVQTPRMEYTATSFAEPLQRVFDDVLHPDIDIEVGHRAESRHYVESVSYRMETSDQFEQRLYEPILRVARRWGDTARSLHNGSVHRYLAYALVVTLLVMVVSG